jgi:DNA repair protein radC
MMKLRDVRPEERPAEKARRLGIASLSDRELLSLLLRSGCRGQDVTALSTMVLEMEPRREGLLGLLHNSMQDYMRLRGVGEAKALQLVAIGELSKRIWRREAAKNLTTAFSDPGLCARYYMEALRHLEQEELHAAFLDTKLRFISDQLLSRGSVDASVVSVRELMIAALRARAVRMILVHNHPSGDPRPSADDQRVTAEVQAAAKLIGIPLEDHIVIGDNAYYSFKEWGLL